MKNLFLIGYRGTGKTVLGKLVAGKLGVPLLDMDDIIIELAGKTIPKIFEEDGEPAFRDFETKALEKACEHENNVISCGGGIITREINIDLLKKHGIVCLLKADPKTIYNRIYRDGNRPALTDKNPYEEIEHILEQRHAAYEKAKDFEVNTSNQNLGDCTEEIVDEFEVRTQ